MSIFNSYTLYQINEINNKYKGHKIGFTCGTFDLLHSGHILMLQDCKNVCDILIIGLQVDPTIDRPHKDKVIQDYEDREVQVKSCKFVDEVIKYTNENDLINILKYLNPDVRILGHDYKKKTYTGNELLTIDIYYTSVFYEKTTVNLRKRIYEMEKQNRNCACSRIDNI